MHGAGTEMAQMIGPERNLPLPKENAVESVSRRQPPLPGKADRSQRRFVNDEKQPSPSRDGGADAGQFLVAAAPLRFGDPLHRTRIGRGFVLADRVVVGAMKKMRPLVHLRRPGLDDPSLADHRHAKRRQRPQYLFVRNGNGRFGDDQIRQIVHVRQARAVEQAGRNRAALPRFEKAPPRRLHLVRAGVKPMHDEAIVQAQLRRLLAAAAAEMDNQSSLHSGSARQIHGAGARRLCACQTRSDRQQQRGETARQPATAYDHAAYPPRTSFIEPIL